MGQRLPSLSVDEVCGALSKAGFSIVRGRGKGSHVYLYRAYPPTGITVPKKKDIKRGTLRAIIRQSGLSVDEFLALL